MTEIVSMRVLLLLAALVSATPSLVRAETPVPALPEPNLPVGSRVSDYLRAAQGAVAANHLGEAENALEMAQTRVLDRSVPLGQTGVPSTDPLIGQITQARQALTANDRAACLQIVGSALAAASSRGI